MIKICPHFFGVALSVTEGDENSVISLVPQLHNPNHYLNISEKRSR